MRAHSREVSTSSAETIQSGDFLNSAEPGKIANRVPRAPRYSRVRSSRTPMLLSSPESRDLWTSSWWAATSISREPPTSMPDWRAIWRSCA